MKGRVVALGRLGAREAAALLLDGRLDDLLVDPADDIPMPGAVYRARVDRPVKGQGGVFLRLGDGLQGFLRSPKGLRPGDTHLVQVTGYAEAGKAIPVTDRLIFKARHAIVTPGAPGVNLSRRVRDEETRARLLSLVEEFEVPETFGVILRSSAAEAPEGAVVEDIGNMLALAQDVTGEVADADTACLLDGPGAHLLAWREWSVPAPDTIATGETAFADHAVDEALDALRSARVPLGPSASMWVEPTRALVAIDVNTGADQSPAAALKANHAAARELPRQLRLRGLGGQITVDFAPLSKKDRRQIETALKTAFRADPVETALVGWTPLGHFELQRKRERPALEI